MKEADRISRKTGIVRDERYLRHDAGFAHPESPERLVAIYRMLDDAEMAGKFHAIAPRHATREELERIHRPGYVNLVAETAGKSHFSLDPDTSTVEDSYDTALLAAGGVCNAIDSIVSGEVTNAFALIRPPGHHAEADRAAGFCLFNNIAVGARYATARHGMKKVLIVDWDLHHGNGTQHSFYEDADILYFSTHQYPYYPGTGALGETGRGKGLGYTINVPLSPGAGDGEYLSIFRRVLKPVALQFKPDMVMVSAGFDIYYQDPLGAMEVTPGGFACLTRILLDIADACCGGKLLMVLEGGYNTEGEAASVQAVLLEMHGDTRLTEADLDKIEIEERHCRDAALRPVVEKIKPYWQFS
ncbi:MAG: histone deacetylase [Deltaproteobacteria bacterium]|nr:histone deacetylase [Deltaproteobacteria bacterium]